MASTYLTRAISSAGNRTTLTISCWFKRSKIGADQHLFSSRDSGVSSSSIGEIKLTSGDILRVEGYSGSAYNYRKLTNRVFRDTNAWYHLVVAYDTSNATADDRIKIYINGERETSFSTSTNPSSSFNTYWFDDTDPFVIGTDVRTLTGASNFDGEMAHINVIDGTAYSPSDFGETDATTGIWKPKTAPSVTYGTNGFFLKFENSASFGTDSSGNGNNFTVNGTMTQTIDTPSNVFATLNPLNVPTSNAPTFSNGNTQSVSSSSVSGSFGGSSTLGVSSGKWYIEAKCLVSGHTLATVGVTYNDSESARTNNDATDSYEYSYRMNGNKQHDNTDSSYGDTYTTNDIIGIALDLDNHKIYWSKNGTWQNSGDPESGATGTGSAFDLDTGQTYMFYHQDVTGASSNTSSFAFNFGNGYFGTTAVSSAQNPDDGIGIFEHSVPNGYKALCTKSINAQEYS